MLNRRNHDSAFKTHVALEGERTVPELVTAYDIHPGSADVCLGKHRAVTMIHQWKPALLAGAACILDRGDRRQPPPRSPRTGPVICMRGSKTWPPPTIVWQESSSPALASAARDDRTEPCKPVGRGLMSSAVDLAVVVLLRVARRDAAELGQMLLIDKRVLLTPFHGIRQMTWHLQNEGQAVNEKRIRLLMR